MSCPCRDFHTIPGSRRWAGVHEPPGLAGAPAWAVTLLVSFLLDPRKCPVAGHLDGAASSSLALPLNFLCVLAESPGLAGAPRAHSLCPCVPVSFRPGSLAAELALPSTPGSLPSSPPRSLPCPQPCISLPRLPEEPRPARRSERSFCRCGMQEGGGTEGRSRAGSHPCPGLNGLRGESRRRKRRGKAGNREKVEK